MLYQLSYTRPVAAYVPQHRAGRYAPMQKTRRFARRHLFHRSAGSPRLAAIIPAPQ